MSQNDIPCDSKQMEKLSSEAQMIMILFYFAGSEARHETEQGVYY
jgi:hypothetical protein